MIPADRLASMSAMTRNVSVLADPTRAQIVRLMLTAADGRVLVGQTATALGLRQPTVSHHMRALLDAGLVTREADGRLAWYRIAPIYRRRLAALLLDDGDGDGAASDSGASWPDLSRISRDLAFRFAATHDPDEVDRAVHEAHALLSANRPPSHVASRTAAFATEMLEARPGRSEIPIPEVLFVCVQNAGRSQIAAGVMRHLAGDRVRVRTAGSEPADDLRHTVLAALDEIGVSVGGEFPKPLTDAAVRSADVVVTMGCGDVCEIHPRTIYIDWDVPDPVGLPLEEVRLIRDDIDARVRDLLRDLVP